MADRLMPGVFQRADAEGGVPELAEGDDAAGGKARLYVFLAPPVS